MGTEKDPASKEGKRSETRSRKKRSKIRRRCSLEGDQKVQRQPLETWKGGKLLDKLLEQEGRRGESKLTTYVRTFLSQRGKGWAGEKRSSHRGEGVKS